MITWIIVSFLFLLAAVFAYGLSLMIILAMLGIKYITTTWALLIMLFGDERQKRRLRLIDKTRDPILKLDRQIAEWKEQNERRRASQSDPL